MTKEMFEIRMNPSDSIKLIEKVPPPKKKPVNVEKCMLLSYRLSTDNHV